jgi:hypothetical protein
MRPVARTPPVMGDGKNSQLLCGDLIDDAVSLLSKIAETTREVP